MNTFTDILLIVIAVCLIIAFAPTIFEALAMAAVIAIKILCVWWIGGILYQLVKEIYQKEEEDGQKVWAF